MNAVIYCRVSTKKQVEEGTSLATQEEVCLDYARRLGYKAIKTFIEEGQSAKSGDRTKFLEMVEFCQHNYKNVDATIFYKVDRFMRDSTEYGLFRALLKKIQIRLLSATESIEDNPSGRFMETMLAAAAQWDNEVRAERSKNGMIEAVKTGRWQWKSPIGYDNVKYEGKANIAPRESQAKFFPEIYRLLRDGYGPEAVRQIMDKAGLRDNNGKMISSQKFHKMIRNKVYIGVIEAFGLQVKAQYPFVGLVEEKLFYEALSVLDGKKKRMPKYQLSNPEFPLRGMYCGCGGTYTGSVVKGRTKKYPKYRCTKCKNWNPDRDLVHQEFKNTLGSLEYNLTHKELLAEAVKTVWEYRNRTNSRRLITIKKEITVLREQQKNIATKNAMGVTSDDLAKNLLEEIDTQIINLTAEEGDLGKIKENVGEVVEFALDYLDNLGDRWDKADIEMKKRFQTFFFPSGLTFYRNGKFGTDTSLLLIQAKTLILDEKSALAAPRGVEPLLPH